MSATEPVPCPKCGGDGQEVIGEHYVTLDMAIDAGDRSLEGMFHSVAYGPCDACGGSGWVDESEVAHEPDDHL